MSNQSHSHFEPCEDELDHPFVMVPTAIIRNPDISPEAKWFLSYLLSHTKKWRISIPYVIKTQKISKNRIYPIIDECIKTGYLKRDTFLEKGMKKYRYFVSREPKFKEFLLCPQNQDTENQDTENEDRRVYQSSSNEEEKKINKKKVDALPTSAEAETICLFFLSKIKEKKPNFSKGVMPFWIKDFEKLLKVRSPQDLEKIINFSIDHDFWFKHILSPEKLLKHLDTLELQMTQSPEKKKSGDKALAEKIAKKYPQNPDISVGSNYIEFNFGPRNRPYIKFGDGGFEEQVFNCLNKLGLSTKDI